MQAFVRFRLEDGTTVDLHHGDLIGRLESARLSFDDPCVSEAHAMVSLRGDVLVLLGLRGRFVVDSKPLSRLNLAAGQRIRLSQATELLVDAVKVEDTVLGLTDGGPGTHILRGVTSISGPAGALSLATSFDPTAAAWVFASKGRWLAQLAGGQPRRIQAGDALSIGPHTLHVTAIDLARANAVDTVSDGGVAERLRVVARYESVHIHRASAPVLVLSGVGARIISELVETRAPTPWELLAGLVWPDADADIGGLRSRFDTAMTRLRHKLRVAGVRDDLVRTDGHGNLELVRYAGDRFENEG